MRNQNHLAAVVLFYFIGNSDFKEQKKEQEFTGRMLDELLPRVRR